MSNFPFNIPFQLFSSCMLVKGSIRSCIYDLQRGDFEYIPNSLHDILIKSNGKTFDEIKDSYPNQEDKENLILYFNFLFENEFIFFSKLNKSFFPKYKLESYRPYGISTLIVDINKFNLKTIEIIKENIFATKVECLVIRIIDSNSEDILNLLSKLNDISTRIIQVFISKSITVEGSLIKDIFEINERISLIIKSDDAEESSENFARGTYIITNNDIINSKIDLVEISDFAPNLDFYMEAKLHHPFYNKRVYINTKGEIFRHEYDGENFGNIKDINLEDVLSNNKFKKYWNVIKDEIEICKDCEHRYICTDSRLPIKKKQTLWNFEKECNYNPYSAEWKKTIKSSPSIPKPF